MLSQLMPGPSQGLAFRSQGPRRRPSAPVAWARPSNGPQDGPSRKTDHVARPTSTHSSNGFYRASLAGLVPVAAGGSALSSSTAGRAELPRDPDGYQM